MEEPNDMQKGIYKFLEVQQSRDMLNEKAQQYHRKFKASFDKKTKEGNFQPRDLFLRWDARREDKSNHGKFDHIWFGNLYVARFLNNNIFVLNNPNDDDLVGGPVNWCFLKHPFVY